MAVRSPLAIPMALPAVAVPVVSALPNEPTLIPALSNSKKSGSRGFVGEAMAESVITGPLLPVAGAPPVLW